MSSVNATSTQNTTHFPYTKKIWEQAWDSRDGFSTQSLCAKIACVVFPIIFCVALAEGVLWMVYSIFPISSEPNTQPLRPHAVKEAQQELNKKPEEEIPVDNNQPKQEVVPAAELVKKEETVKPVAEIPNVDVNTEKDPLTNNQQKTEEAPAAELVKKEETVKPVADIPNVDVNTEKDPLNNNQQKTEEAPAAELVKKEETVKPVAETPNVDVNTEKDPLTNNQQKTEEAPAAELVKKEETVKPVAEIPNVDVNTEKDPLTNNQQKSQEAPAADLVKKEETVKPVAEIPNVDVNTEKDPLTNNQQKSQEAPAADLVKKEETVKPVAEIPNVIVNTGKNPNIITLALNYGSSQHDVLWNKYDPENQRPPASIFHALRAGRSISFNFDTWSEGIQDQQVYRISKAQQFLIKDGTRDYFRGLDVYPALKGSSYLDQISKEIDIPFRLNLFGGMMRASINRDPKPIAERIESIVDKLFIPEEEHTKDGDPALFHNRKIVNTVFIQNEKNESMVLISDAKKVIAFNSHYNSITMTTGTEATKEYLTEQLTHFTEIRAGIEVNPFAYTSCFYLN